MVLFIPNHPYFFSPALGMTGIEGRLAQTNGRLRSANIGVAVESRGNRLYLRATFPPKPASGRNSSYQQRLALGYTDLYHAWLSANEHRRCWDALMQRSDRPMPPVHL